MKKEKRIPTIIGLVILIAGIASGIFLVKKEQIFNPRASQQQAPTQVRISNVSDTAFTVSWITQDPTIGYVIWGPKNSSLDNVAKRSTDANNLTKNQTHYIRVTGLSPTTNYAFKLASDNQNNLYDNNGQAYEIMTGPTLGSLPAPDTIFGTILNPDGTPAKDAIVHLTLANAQPVSTQVKANGNWVISLSTIRTTTLDTWVKYDINNTVLDLSIQSQDGKSTSVVTTTGCARPVPTLSLGKSHDFRDLCDGAGGQVVATPTPMPTSTPSPTSNSSPQPTTAADTGTITPTPTTSPSGSLTIDNPAYDGEEINTQVPEFYGSSTDLNTVPEGTVLTIKVESDQSYTGTATIDDSGDWAWNLPTNTELEPGEHTITLSYIDNQGEEQTLTRTFVIAAGDSETPAFEASPSAETSPSATPTSSPSATPTLAPRTAMPSTEAGVPAPGYLTPTILVFMLGIVLFITGLTVLRF